MKQITLFFVAIGLAATALCSDRPVSSFGFQGVALNASFTTIDSEWLRNCVQSKDTRRDFCLTKSTAGEVPLTVEIGFLDGYVQSIHVSFPRTEYETVLAALRLKNGNESVVTPLTARWWSHSPAGKTFPDSILLRKLPDPQPKVDGIHWLQGIEYSEIEFFSAWTRNNPADNNHSEQNRKVQEVLHGL